MASMKELSKKLEMAKTTLTKLKKGQERQKKHRDKEREKRTKSGNSEEDGTPVITSVSPQWEEDVE